MLRRHSLLPGVFFVLVRHPPLFLFRLFSLQPSFLPILLLLSPVSWEASRVGMLLVRMFELRLNYEIAAPAQWRGIFRLVCYAVAWFSALITERMEVCAYSQFQ